MFWLTSASRNPFLKEPGRSLRKWIIMSWQSLLETCSTVPNCSRQKPNSFKPSYFHVTWFLKMWLSYTNNAGWAFCLFHPHELPSWSFIVFMGDLPGRLQNTSHPLPLSLLFQIPDYYSLLWESFLAPPPESELPLPLSYCRPTIYFGQLLPSVITVHIRLFTHAFIHLTYVCSWQRI